ncbi:MAG: ATP synthase F0 subunit B [Candidatus Poribacteria bacterium]
MGEVLEQLGLDGTFFYQFIIFAGVFFTLSKIYFKPFYNLFEKRHKRIKKDRESAEKLINLAQAKLDQYSRMISEEKAGIKKMYDIAIMELHNEEASIITKAREEARKITKEAAESAVLQQDELKKRLELDVEAISRSVSERLLSRKV